MKKLKGKSIISRTIKFAVVSLLIVFPAYGENIRFKKIETRHGLSQSVVTDILQDHIGFLWIGTLDGLNKYDGITISVYKNDPDKPDSLDSNEIASIMEDGDQNLWVSTASGTLNRYDREKDSFIRYPLKTFLAQEEPIISITKLIEDAKKRIWVGTKNRGLIRCAYDAESENLLDVITFHSDKSIPDSLSHDYIRDLLIDRNGNLWIGTFGGGINIFDDKNNRFIHTLNDPDTTESLSSNVILSLYEDSLGTIWVGTDSGLNELVFYKGNDTPAVFKRYRHDKENPSSLGHDYVYAIAEDKSGGLWLGTYGGGLDFLERGNDTFTHFQHDPSDNESISSDTILSLFRDRSQLIWAGTLGGGLNKIFSMEKRFAHFKAEDNNPDKLDADMVFSLYEDKKGIVYIGTNKGIFLLHRNKEKAYKPWLLPGLPEVSNSSRIKALKAGTDGHLWIGSFGFGLIRWDLSAGRMDQFYGKYSKKNGLSSNYINTICVDKAGFIWVGTEDAGLNRINPENAALNESLTFHFFYDPAETKSLSDNNVRCLFEDLEENIWIGTRHGGLNKIECSQKTKRHPEFFHFKNDPDNPNSISANHILSIYESQSGNFWIGTSGGGLNRFDRENQTFIHYTEKDGLSGNTVYGIEEDEEGRLWLSTNRGISRFDPRIDSFIRYDMDAGLQDREFNAGAYYKNSRGEIFFGGINGFNVFDPDKKKKNLYHPPLVVTKLLLENSMDGKELIRKNQKNPEEMEVHLPYKHRSFSIRFASLDFTRPSENQYAYRVEPVDENWHFLGFKNEVSFSHLKPGRYTIRIKGTNSDGIWSRHEASINLRISPLFWKSPLFSALLFVFLMVSLYTAVKIRARFLFLKKEHKIDILAVLNTYDLSKRELEIVEHIIRGKSNNEIADTLFISQGTVKNHIYNIFKKLRVKNRIQVIQLLRKKSHKNIL
ncbi:MAG: hypothetical protein JXB26_14520 [Candidatus Aminicenantes bacterium]|nr:hypothetical protein [Candidatus Aminicenantes bacterium]